MAERYPTAQGARLHSVSVFGGYYSGFAGLMGFPARGGSRGSDLPFGAGAVMGWSRARESASFAATYAPGFIASGRDPDLRAFQHALTLTGAKKLSPRWRASLAVGGGLSSSYQFLFAPGLASQIVAVPATFDDLVNAVLKNNYTNSELASILTGAPMIETPARTLLYGERVLSTAASAGLSYARSPRTQLHFWVSGFRYQYMNAENPQDEAHLLARTTSAVASAGLSHVLTPRTSLTVNSNARRTFSQYEDAYFLDLDAILGRTLTPRWLLQVHGGPGVIKTVRKTSELPTGPQYQGGASITYKHAPHTLTASAHRAFGDAYGIGASSTWSLGGAWQWRRPGSDWQFQASYNQHYYTRSIAGYVNGWQVAGGATKRISRHTMLALEAVHISYSTKAITQDTRQDAIRAVFTWNTLPATDR